MITKKDSVMLIGLTSETENPKPYMQADSARPAGKRYQHKFRATNEAGGLVLMDKTAVIYSNDSVLIFSF